jgi:hypothetical protein
VEGSKNKGGAASTTFISRRGSKRLPVVLVAYLSVVLRDSALCQLWPSICLLAPCPSAKTCPPPVSAPMSKERGGARPRSEVSKSKGEQGGLWSGPGVSLIPYPVMTLFPLPGGQGSSLVLLRRGKG